MPTTRGGRNRPAFPTTRRRALLGLATVSNIVRELQLLKPRQRERMFAAVAGWIMR